MQEEVLSTPEVHHVIGKSQNFPENIPLLLKKYAGNPAIKIFIHIVIRMLNHAHLLLGIYPETHGSSISMYQNSFVPGVCYTGF